VVAVRKLSAKLIVRKTLLAQSIAARHNGTLRTRPRLSPTVDETVALSDPTVLRPDPAIQPNITPYPSSFPAVQERVQDQFIQQQTQFSRSDEVSRAGQRSARLRDGCHELHDDTPVAVAS
jgi:hypothetical protein